MSGWDLHKDITDIMNEFGSFRQKNWAERQLSLLYSCSVTKGETKLANNYEKRMDARIRAMNISLDGLRAEVNLVKGKLDADTTMRRLVAKSEQGLLSSEEPARAQLPPAPPTTASSPGSPMSTHLTDDQIDEEIKAGVRTILEAGDYSSGMGVVARRLEAKGLSSNVIHEIQGMIAMYCRKNGM
jgi:hypothetical protein